MNIKAEFHCHSTASDGTYSPSKLVEEGKKNGVTILSLTDHDITSGLQEAKDYAKKLNVNFIPGIELSCQHKDSSVHILGYFKDDTYTCKEFQDFLNDLKNSRIERAKKIVNNLKEHFNIQIDYLDVLAKGKGVVARPHIAQCIIDAKYPYNWEHIFDNFIGNNSPAYVSNKKISVEEGLSILKKYNALTFLAHPKLIKKDNLNEILKFPFDGIEAVYFQNFKYENDYFLSLARKNNLLVTCGSDFHGTHEGDGRHGHIGDMSLDEYDFNRFMEAYN